MTVDDVNCDGEVNCDAEADLLDAEPFVDLLSNEESSDRADINKDGEVRLLDVAPFAACLLADNSAHLKDSIGRSVCKIALASVII